MDSSQLLLVTDNTEEEKKSYPLCSSIWKASRFSVSRRRGGFAGDMELDRLHVKSEFGLLSGWSILFALSGESISKPIGVTLFTPVFRWDFVSGFLFLLN